MVLTSKIFVLLKLNANKVKAKRPIVLINGQDAKKLITIIKKYVKINF